MGKPLDRNGVVDHTQTDLKVVHGDGSVTETLSNYNSVGVVWIPGSSPGMTAVEGT